MEGTGANLRLPLNPPFFFESAVQYDVDDGCRARWRPGFAELVPLDQPSGQVRAWRSEPAPAVHAAVERVRRVPADAVDVGEHRLRRQPRRPTWSRRSKATSRCRASAIRTRGRRCRRAVRCTTRRRSSRTSRRRRRKGTATTTRCRRASASATSMGSSTSASYTLSRTRTNNLGYYGSGGVAAEGAYWMNAYDPEANYGPAFFDARHNFVFSANYEMPYGRGRTHGSDISPRARRRAGRLAPERHLPGALRLPDHRDRRAGAVAAGHARQRTAQLRRRSGAGGPGHQPLAGHHRPSRARAKGTFGNCGVGVARAPGYKNIDAVLAKQFSVGGARYFEFRAEAFNLFNLRASVRPRATSTRRTRSVRSRRR